MRDIVHTQACERARTWASLSLDGELSELERRLMRAHLVRCAVCAAFAADVEALVTEVRTAPLEPVPASAQTQVWRLRPTAPVVRLASRAAAVVAAAAAGFAMFSLGAGSVGDVGSVTSQPPIIVDETTLADSQQEIADLRDARRLTLLTTIPPQQAAVTHTGNNAL